MRVRVQIPFEALIKTKSMKTFRKGHNTVNCIDPEADKTMKRRTQSESHPRESRVQVREDEDSVFGSLTFFFKDDAITKARMKAFFKF